LSFGSTQTLAYTTHSQETINDTIYQSIHGLHCLNESDQGFVCHLRSEGNLVFIKVDGQEYALYDFNLTAGETYLPPVCEVDNDIMIMAGSPDCTQLNFRHVCLTM
jgi:hypothetical protein